MRGVGTYAVASMAVLLSCLLCGPLPTHAQAEQPLPKQQPEAPVGLRACSTLNAHKGETTVRPVGNAVHVVSQPVNGEPTCVILDLPGAEERALVSDDIGIVALRSGLAILDLRNPSAPVHRMTMLESRRVSTFRISNGQLWAIDQDGQIVRQSVQSLRDTVKAGFPAIEPSANRPPTSSPGTEQPVLDRAHSVDGYTLLDRTVVRAQRGERNFAEIQLPYPGRQVITYLDWVFVSLAPVGLAVIDGSNPKQLVIESVSKSYNIEKMSIENDVISLGIHNQDLIRLSIRKYKCFRNRSGEGSETFLSKDQQPFEINTESFANMVSIGVSSGGIQKFCSSVELPGPATNILKYGDVIYATLGGEQSGIAVIDIKDPFHPKYVRKVLDGRHLVGLRRQSNELLGWDRGRNMYSLSLHDPRTPTLTKFVDAKPNPVNLTSAIDNDADDERPIRRTRNSDTATSLLIAGPSMWVISYLLTVVPVIIADSAYCTTNDIDCRHSIYYIPILGPWIDQGLHSWGGTTYVPVVSGLLQGTGLALTIAGLGLRARANSSATSWMILPSGNGIVFGGAF